MRRAAHHPLRVLRAQEPFAGRSLSVVRGGSGWGVVRRGLRKDPTRQRLPLLDIDPAGAVIEQFDFHQDAADLDESVDPLGPLDDGDPFAGWE